MIMTIDNDNTLSIAKTSLLLPTLRFPNLWFLLEGNVYNIENAKNRVFTQWITTIINKAALEHYQVLWLTTKDTWTLAERWELVNALAEAGIDWTQYLYDDIQAAMAALDDLMNAPTIVLPALVAEVCGE